MEDGGDGRRVTHVVAVTSRQVSCWPSPDIHYQPGSSNLASGSGTNSHGNRMSRSDNRSEEAGEFWVGGRICGQDVGKGPECSRSVGRSSAQMPSKVVSGRASGIRRAPRPLHHGSAGQGQWNALHGGSGKMDESLLSGTDGEANSSIDVGMRVGLSEGPGFASHSRRNTNPELSLGRSGAGKSDLYRATPQSSSSAEHLSGRVTGQSADKGSFRGGSSSSPQTGRYFGLSNSAGCHSRMNVTDEARPGDTTHHGTAPLNSLADREVDVQADQHPGASNCKTLAEAFLASGGNNEGSLSEKTARSGDTLFLSSTSADRSLISDSHCLKGNSAVASLSTSCAASFNLGTSSSSRGSACKRKSCAPGLTGGLPCRSGSPHYSGCKEIYGGKATGGSNSSRRSVGNLGCASASDFVGSASAAEIGRCAETSVASIPLEEPRSRKGTMLRDVRDEDVPAGRSTKISLSSGSSSTSRSVQDGVCSGQLDQSSCPIQPSFPRAVRRVIPALQPDSRCARRVSLADNENEVDLGNNTRGGNPGRSTEDMVGSAGGRQSSSPSGSRSSAASSSPRHNDNVVGVSAFGERFSHRYLGSISRNLTSSSSSASHQVGGVGIESRFRSRNIYSNVDSMNVYSGAATQGSVSQVSNLPSSSLLTTVPSPSRPPPHPPIARSRHHFSSLHITMLSPTSGPAPSRLPPSPPSSASSSTALDMLASPSNLFQSSLLSRPSASLDGRSQGLSSAAENLLGMPFHGLHSSEGGHPPRLVAEGLAEFLLALDRVERDEDLTYEQLLMLEATLLFGRMGLHDQHSELRLDVDNMSYEELLALEERIGNVSTGLTVDIVNNRLKRSKYSSQVALTSFSQESDMKCSICQEEYGDGDELGRVDCGHSYHVSCIKQWLLEKNQCPICKASAFS